MVAKIAQMECGAIYLFGFACVAFGTTGAFTSTEMSLPAHHQHDHPTRAVPGVAFLFPEICKMHITDVKLTSASVTSQ
jgi:hypothetical protein